jgi:hypothetical protein
MPKSALPLYCLGLLGTLAACEMLAPPSPLPATATVMTPPEQYHTWWAATEACSGLTGDFNAIQWYVVPDSLTFTTESGEKVGLWSESSAGTRIILAGAYADHELVVRHEMLHALLDREGHPPQYFQTKCGLTWEAWRESNDANEAEPQFARAEHLDH